MSEQPPIDPPPPSVPPPAPPGPVHHDTKGDSKDGCAFVMGVFGGFIVCFFAGFMVLATAGQKANIVIPTFLVAVALLAIWLAFKPSWRGFAIGILLCEGAMLLLIAICSGFKI